ncbi:hypothetical protein IX39_15265 [Chryseobacterium formosense]|uniref:C-type lysozyme inhibitor domain-containing protein n=1 Tax=Chryseobacterium formosense TaxID=236814 RepID=A0A085Z2W1_9FLAO|nr:hypothetical protein [Chryseobacterium formosense]KFE98774.1 hypothetical protein IX39_15265 [Chryseobacterium formosense]SFT57294.1 hypothetical protein SAMN05421857_1748 [Chryseobacterium formosense]
MIKKIIALCMLSSLVIACKKEGNKGVVKSDSANTEILADNGTVDSTIAYNVSVNGTKTVKTDFVYQAIDGSPVKVVFNYDPNNRTVSIRNNNKTFVLDKTEAKPNQTTYEKEDMKAVVKGDSLILHQGENIIELVKTKI